MLGSDLELPPTSRRYGPTEAGLFCCLTKLCIIPPSMAVKKKTVQRSLDLAGNAEATMTRYWTFARGRRMAQPETDRRPLRLRAMPPGRLRRKRQNPHPAGRHNNRAGPCGRVRRLRGAVVGGTGGQRSSMTDPRILDGTIRGYREPLPCYRAPTANDFSGAVSVSCMATTCGYHVFDARDRVAV